MTIRNSVAGRRAGAWLALALVAGGARPAWSEDALAVSPGARKVRLRVGERQRFRAKAPNGSSGFSWRLDGRAVADGTTTWEFTPTAPQVGTHELLVTDHGSGLTRHGWAVRVEPPLPPRVLGTAPAAQTLEVDEREGVRLSMQARPSARGETVRTTWTVDGAAAGEGDSVRLVLPRAGRVRARAVAVGSLGSAVVREWEIVVRPVEVAALTPTTTSLPPPPRPTTTLPPPARRPTSTTTLPALARAPQPTTPTAPAAVPPQAAAPEVASIPPSPAPGSTPPAPVPGSTPAVTTRDVEALLERYAAAWREHDVEELRRMGLVTSNAQAEALQDYFDRTRDLDVEVRLLDVTTEGERLTVRFIRQDRFRNPAGRVVSQESPPLQKDVVRTPGGLRMVSPAR